jgi:hypothetical protein
VVFIIGDSDSDWRLVPRNEWRRVANVEDRGGWGLRDGISDDDRKRIMDNWKDDCPSLDENVNHQHRRIEDIINMPGGTDESNLAALRCNGVKLKFKYFSAREIRPPTPD